MHRAFGCDQIGGTLDGQRFLLVLIERHHANGSAVGYCRGSVDMQIPVVMCETTQKRGLIDHHGEMYFLAGEIDIDHRCAGMRYQVRVEIGIERIEGKLLLVGIRIIDG
jgi:hypothetical protein